MSMAGGTRCLSLSNCYSLSTGTRVQEQQVPDIGQDAQSSIEYIHFPAWNGIMPRVG
jgi:hypothetical protein